jgi:hypothetical protein
VAVTMDVVTPRVFDNQYFRNLQSGMGLLASDQVLLGVVMDRDPNSSSQNVKALNKL